jgi:NaMN:DMB phosphoribosyltransferase
MKQKIKAAAELRLASFTIPQGTVGHISRISPRLKKTHVYRNQRPDALCVKFPGHASFFCLKHEVTKL